MRLVSSKKSVDNTRGKVFYGIHFYPGISEMEFEGRTERLYVSDTTIRKMDASMRGCPVYCYHKKPVGNIDEVKGEADGWVESSFYNEADGKHWAKFLAVSSKAISQCESKRFGLSNGYDILAESGESGSRNGVEYDSEVTDGEFHHLAIVPNPRYESMILTPEEFMEYNANKRDETRRVANSKAAKKEKSMSKPVARIQFFTRKKVENSKDLENHSVLLPKSGVEKSISELVKIADRTIQNEGKPRVCNADDVVKVEEDGEESEMTIGEIIERMSALESRIEELEAGEVGEDDDELEDEEVDNEDDDGDDEEEDSVDNEDDSDEDDDDEVENEEPKPVKKKAKLAMAEKAVKTAKNKKKGVKNSASVFRIGGKQAKKQVKNAKAKRKADAVREAPKRVQNAGEMFAVDTVEAKLDRGMERYGRK
jgi:hypothetical protein